jgi:hypothetical protein
MIPALWVRASAASHERRPWEPGGSARR